MLIQNYLFFQHACTTAVCEQGIEFGSIQIVMLQPRLIIVVLCVNVV